MLEGRKGKGEEGTTYIVPTFGEEPPDLFGVFVPGEFWIAVLEVFHDLGFGAIDFDVGGFGAMARIVGIGAADVGYFEHHVGRTVLFPEGDADVLHAVAWSGCG